MSSQKSWTSRPILANGGVKKASSPRQSTPTARKLTPGASSARTKKSPSQTPKPTSTPTPQQPVKLEGDVRKDAWRSEVMFKIIDLIKSDERPFQFSEVQLHMQGAHWQTDAVLLKSLRDSANVEIDEKAQQIQYKWKYSIKNKNDLLDVLRAQKGVVQIDDITANSFCKHLPVLTNELAKEGWIRILDRQKGTELPKSIYFDPWSQSEECRKVTISDADRELWEQVKVDPDQVDAELKKMELTSINIAEKPKSQKATDSLKKKARRQTSRAVKLVNTHLNLDWVDLIGAKTK